MPGRIPGLNDTQKCDLSTLWERHAPTHLISLGSCRNAVDGASYGYYRGRGRGRTINNGAGRGANTNATKVVTIHLEDEDYNHICRLQSFLRSIICCVEFDEHGRENDSPLKKGGVAPTPTTSGLHNLKREHAVRHKNSTTRQSLMRLFKVVQTVQSGNNSNVLIVPKIMGGNQVIPFNHALFLQELSDFENNSLCNTEGEQSEPPIDSHISPNSTFGSYLHGSPDRALACLGCAIGITILTLWRRHQSPTTASLISAQNNQSHPNLLILHSAFYHPRFYHLAPSSRVQMAHIRTSIVDCLVSLRGIVTKARPKRLRVLDAGFTCTKCGSHQICQFYEGKYSTPSNCVDSKCKNQKFVLNRKTANFCDVQELKVQEIMEEFCEGFERSGGIMDQGGDHREAGRAPRHMEVEVSNDLVDQCHAGDSIVVVGIVRALNSALATGRGGKRAAETSTYKLYVVAHSIVNLTAEDGSGENQWNEKNGGDKFDINDQHRRIKRQRTTSTSGTNYTDQQLEEIANLAHADHRMYSMPTRMAFPFDLLVRSLCPSIIGNDLVKAGMILCLLGGTSPDVSGLESLSGFTIRSNAHMLIVGDPGMGKSQMLLSANQVAARSVYVGGNTASSTGLTVSLTKEAGGEMGIEAGALILADRGVCCLDELDKMPKSHHDGLLEAMEQQQISIAKAGVVASLPSRCSVIAAANPKSGHYNMGKSVAENLNMAGPLLSRFDLVFILRDEADCDRDRMISEDIMGRVRKESFLASETDEASDRFVDIMDQFGAGRVPLKHRLPWVASFQKQPLPMQLLKDYISYAREHCKPKMTDAAADVLHSYFMRLRHPDTMEQKKNNVPITTRQLEALIRLSQARAKACLRPYVLREDAEDVVELMIESVKQVHMDEGGNIDKVKTVGGKSKQRRGFLNAMHTSGQSEFEFNDLQQIAGRLSLPLNGFKEFVENLRESGDIQRKYNGSSIVYSLIL